MSTSDNFREAYYEEDWGAIERIVRKRPKLIHEKVCHRDTILHDLLRRISPDPNEHVQRIIEMDPTTAQDTTGFNSEELDTTRFNPQAEKEGIVPGEELLPVHLAVIGKSISLETLKLIVEAYPEGLLITDTHGNTPLHYAFLWFDGADQEKRRYLTEANPAAASVKSFNGSFPLHYAAQYGKAEPDTLHALYQANPSAISEKNLKGHIPLELAVKKKFRCLADDLRELDPSAPPKPESKASLWVKRTYGERYVNSRLKFDGSLPDESTQKMSLTLPPDDSIAEKAIRFSIEWLSTGDELRIVGLVSTSLRLAVAQPHLWEATLKELENKLPLHSEHFVPEEDELDFPPEFVDPRHSPAYDRLDSFKKATHLAQYRSMALAFFRDDMDEAGETHMKELLADLRDTVRQANDHGYFEECFDDDDGSLEDEGACKKPANVQEALARCTLDAVKQYCVKTCVDEFFRRGIEGYGSEVVMDGWEGFDFGNRQELGWILFCHKIGGLGVVVHGWRGLSNW